MASPILRNRDTTSSSRSKSTFIPISPRAMTTKYYEFWDHATSTITQQLQNESMEYTKYRYPFYENVPSSLELLERVLHTNKNKNNDNTNTTYNTNTTDQNTEYESEYEQVDKYIAFICNHGKCDGHRPRRRRSNNATNNVEQPIPIPIPKCLTPDTVATRAVANRIRTERRTTQPYSSVALPILNVGYPKLGSTTLHTYFNCIGIPSDHGQNGPKMNNRTKHQQPLFDPKSRPKAAYMQLDSTFWDQGIYPQISLLDELHDDYPNATFVLNFRPIQDWLASLSNWHGMRSRLQHMTIPGLILTDAQRQHRHHALHLLQHNISLGTLRHQEREDVAITNQQLARWVCGHVNHLREYVHWYPSHTLLELDLYDTIGTSRVLYDIFQASASNLPQPDNTITNSTSTTADDTTITTNYNRYKSLTPNNEDVIVNKNTSCWGHTNKGDHKTIRQRRKWRERNNTTSIGTKKEEGGRREE